MTWGLAKKNDISQIGAFYLKVFATNILLKNPFPFQDLTLFNHVIEPIVSPTIVAVITKRNK
jgi:hypothetical protein